MFERKKQICLLAFLLVFSISAYSQVKKIRKEFLNANSKNVLVAAHRAVHHEFPENSIPAVKEGIRLGIDIVEIDVKVSKDGIPMLMHDGTINRTTNGKGDLEEQTFDALRKLRLKVNGKLTDEQIPTLEEILLTAKGKIMVDLDLKTDRMQAVFEVIKKTGTGNIVFFFDSDYGILKTVDQANKKYFIMPRAYNYAMADSALHLFSPEVIHIDSKFYTPEVTKLIKSKDARIWINALGLPDMQIRKGKITEVIDELTKYGANIIQTDEPEMVLKALQAAGKHW